MSEEERITTAVDDGVEKNVDSHEIEEVEENCTGGEEGEEDGTEEADEAPPLGESPEELVAQGKKFLAAGDAVNALECLQDACSVLAEQHGQVSREMAEPYYLYGRALLEVAREKSGVFGGGVPGGASEGAGETSSAAATETTGPSQVPTGDGTNATVSTDPEAGTKVTNNIPEPGDGTNASDNIPADGRTSSSHSANGPASGEQEGQDDEQGGEEEESDLQLAWEILELARIICQKETEPEFRLKLADVNLALGEVGLESDQYDQAITDFQSSLRLREFVLEPTDRRIAEVYFHLGLAYTLAKQAQQATSAYQSAKTTLIKRKVQLEELLGAGTADRGISEEVAELEELIKDIESKVVDARELQKVLEEKENEKGAGDVEFSSTFDTPTEAFTKVSEVQVKSKGPVNDISHLVRKRKCDGDTDQGPVKQMKLNTDETVATADTNGSCAGEKTELEAQVQ